MRMAAKDPSGEKDYVLDLRAATNGHGETDWLPPGDNITEVTITPQTGITVPRHSFTDDQVTVWVAGGTNGVDYQVAIRFTTALGRIDERTMIIPVKDL